MARHGKLGFALANFHRSNEYEIFLKGQRQVPETRLKVSKQRSFRLEIQVKQSLIQSNAKLPGHGRQGLTLTNLRGSNEDKKNFVRAQEQVLEGLPKVSKLLETIWARIQLKIVQGRTVQT